MNVNVFGDLDKSNSNRLRKKNLTAVNTRENGKKEMVTVDRELPQEVLLQRIEKLGNTAVEQSEQSDIKRGFL